MDQSKKSIMPSDKKSGIFRDENHRVASHLTKGLKAMKNKKWKHGDLNPSNICCVTENGQLTYKIGDFKTATKEEAQDDEQKGLYKPPPSVRDQVDTDLYSLGMIMYNMSFKIKEDDKEKERKKIFKEFKTSADKKFHKDCQLKKEEHKEYSMIEDLTISQKKDDQLITKVEADLKEWAIEIEAEKIIIGSNPDDDQFEANIKILRESDKLGDDKDFKKIMAKFLDLNEEKVKCESEQDQILSVTYSVECERKYMSKHTKKLL